MGWRIKHGVGDMNAIEAGGGRGGGGGGEIGDEGYAQQNQNFTRYGIGGEISTTLLVFILDYFQDKLMAKFFKQSKKKNYFGAILGPGKRAEIFQLSTIVPKITNE